MTNTTLTPKTQAFLDWFTYSDNSIDGQSRKKAYTFIESNLVSDSDIGTVKSLQQIHAYIFGGLYDFAGKIRTKTISKGGTMFFVLRNICRTILKTSKKCHKILLTKLLANTLK